MKVAWYRGAGRRGIGGTQPQVSVWPSDEFFEAKMKIDNPLLAQVTTGALQPSSATSETRGNSGSGGAGAPTDLVQLSNLTSVLRDLDTADPDRTAHIAHIARLVQSGEYTVDPVALASRVINQSTILS